jgi:hypothetical protein
MEIVSLFVVLARSSDMGTATVGINQGYVLMHLNKALLRTQVPGTPEQQATATKKAEAWSKVFANMLSSEYDIGSRTPLKNVPGWATLEVVTGGFATGELLAGGALQDHEIQMLREFSLDSDNHPRLNLNRYFLSEAGIALLQARLESGCFEIQVPEEGALLTVAWLLSEGYSEKARSLLEIIGPYFSKLRFYPILTDKPCRASSLVCLQNVGKTIADLKKIKPKRLILAQKESIDIWIPLYDSCVELFLETVQGPTPFCKLGNNGKPIRDAAGRFQVAGGWPCLRFPEDWKVRAQALLKTYAQQRAKHKVCLKPEKSKDSFAQLRKFLAICIDDSTRLTGCEVGRIRLILARYRSKRGLPYSPSWDLRRTNQKNQVAAPMHVQLAHVAAQRLQALDPDFGLDDAEPILQRISAQEAVQYAIAEGSCMPSHFVRKVDRCVNASVAELVEKGVIPSGEILAKVLPQMTANIRASGLKSANLRQLYAAVYAAFRRRRSLLLLNLNSQIKLEELPWVAVMNEFRNNAISERELSLESLKEIVFLTFSSFPEAIVPNKLLQEFRSLVQGANATLPLVDEIAADIFMGTFSKKFLDAAQVASKLLQGTLYERYYGLNYGEVDAIQDVKNSRYQVETSKKFEKLCRKRAYAHAGISKMGWSVAKNGIIIEQQQILTTQNLAALTAVLELTPRLASQWQSLAQRCFRWVCKRLQVKNVNHHARLIMVKNTAYAWRQMVFFLSLCSSSQQREFADWAKQHLASQPPSFQERFEPAWQALEHALLGNTNDFSAVGTSNPGKVFLGWTISKHWLLSS